MVPDPNRADIIHTVYNLTAKLRNVKDAAEAFKVIAEEVRSATNADFAALFLVEKGSPHLKAYGVSGVDVDSKIPLPAIHIDEEFRRRASTAGEPVVLRFDSPSDVPSVARDLARTIGVDHALICSIILRGEFIGYLAVGAKKGSPPFTDDTEAFIGATAASIAIAIDDIRTHMRLSRAKEDTERLLAVAPIGIFTCDPKGIFTSVNRQMLQMLDRESEEELIGTSVFELPLMTKSGLDAPIIQAMEGHEAEKADVHLVPRQDKAIYLHAKATPIKSDRGDVQSILLVVMDISSKVRLQNQLERSYEKLTQTYQELERVTKMKTQFIDVVSHELRTPLTVMRGYIDLVESEYSSQLDPKFSSRLKIIKANTDKLYALVESMLDVSRLEKRSLQIHHEPVRVDTILEEIIQNRLHDAEEKRQSLTLEVEGRLPLMMADRRRLKDVFNNIVDNALKYTQEGGRVQVSARDEGRMIHVWVKDNGVGIPLENLGKIFDRFHIVASDDLSHQVNRLGLGLPIAKGIIEAHGGRIWVESQVGKGSVFHVDLPKEQPKSA